GPSAFGIIAAGAVVIIESIVARISQHDPTGFVADVRDRIYEAVAEVVRPTMFSLLIIIAAYLPIFLLERVEGRIFAPMANTVVAALIGAMLVSLTLIPVLASFCYRRPIRHRVSPLLTAAQRVYAPTLDWALRNGWLVVLGSVLALSVALVTLAPL